MNIKKIQAFTLVELIVVITILAILGIIAFISLQGYSTQARDSTRISDLSSIKTSIELFQLDAGKYPQPTTGVNITYSGGLVWTQGIFGKTVYTNVSKLDKIPTDPQSDKEYTYSVTSTRSEYQLGGIVEGDQIGMNNIVSQTNAGEVDATAYITGNYNGLMTKSNSGTTCRVLSIPSIITNDTSVADLQQIITEQRFVYSGYKNLPSSFISSKFKYNGGFAFTTNNLISYSDTGSCVALTDTVSYTARVLLLKGLQDAYTGTILKNVGEIKNIVSLNINTSSPSIDVVNYSGNFVNNILGGQIDTSISSLGGNSCNTTQPTNATVTVGTPTSLNQAWQSSNSSVGCFFTCNAGYGSNGTSCELSSSCTSSLTEYTLSNGQTWSCKNLGATTVWNGGSTFICNTATDCSNRPNWAGDLYQRGRNEPITFGSFITNTFTGTGMTGNVGNNNMYKGDASFGDWRQNEVGSTTPVRWTGTNPRGPCSSGRHVPSQNEWQLACNNILGSTCTQGKAYDALISTTLRLPSAGDRYGTTGSYEQSTNYWASTPYIRFAYSFLFSTAGIYTEHQHYRSMGYSVRCLKNY